MMVGSCCVVPVDVGAWHSIPLLALTAWPTHGRVVKRPITILLATYYLSVHQGGSRCPCRAWLSPAFLHIPHRRGRPIPRHSGHSCAPVQLAQLHMAFCDAGRYWGWPYARCARELSGRWPIVHSLIRGDDCIRRYGTRTWPTLMLSALGRRNLHSNRPT